MRLSILDDYQGVALEMADWSAVRARGIEIAVERFPFADEDDVVRSLADSEIVAAMRERTAFSKRIVDRLPKLKLLITTGMRNASFDMTALKEALRIPVVISSFSFGRRSTIRLENAVRSRIAATISLSASERTTSSSSAKGKRSTAISMPRARTADQSAISSATPW